MQHYSLRYKSQLVSNKLLVCITNIATYMATERLHDFVKII